MSGRKFFETSLQSHSQSKPIYRRISVYEAQQNNEYWRVLENMFHEQAARVLQRAWRSKKQLSFDPKKYHETLTNNAQLLRFIQETTEEDKALEHAQLINSQDSKAWEKLDYKDPEFVRNIFKALRIEAIDKPKMATALLLYEAQVEFGNAAKHHLFSEKGPYSPSNIFYATSQSIQDFHKKLLQLSPEYQCYFSVNFSKLREALFLYDILEKDLAGRYGYLQHILKMFIFKLKMSKQDESRYLRAINDLNNQWLHVANSAKTELQLLIKNTYKQFSNHLDYNNNEAKSSPHNASQRLLMILLRVNPKLPMVEISPDCNVSVDSPLLCMIILPTPTFFALQDTMHGGTATIEPYFTVGQSSTRLMKKLDEDPAALGQKKSSRQVEHVHPDLIQDQDPHGCGVGFPFTLALHDLAHVWTSNIITDKHVIRYLRKLITTETGFEMSKSIWHLTDMNFPFYEYMIHPYRDSLATQNKFDKTLALSYVINTTGTLWSNTDSDNINLLFIIDMIVNNKKWTNDFLPNIPPEHAFSLDQFNKWFGKQHIINHTSPLVFTTADPIHFQSAFASMKNIITREKAENKIHATEYYILAYRLSKHPKGLALCNKLDAIGVDKFLTWKQHGSLQFTVKQKNVAIEKLTPKELYTNLLDKLIEFNRGNVWNAKAMRDECTLLCRIM
jgi:hypothetical protein